MSVSISVWKSIGTRGVIRLTGSDLLAVGIQFAQQSRKRGRQVVNQNATVRQDEQFADEVCGALSFSLARAHLSFLHRILQRAHLSFLHGNLPLRPRPAGTNENSPALQCRVCHPERSESRRGRQNWTRRFLPSPAGLAA